MPPPPHLRIRIHLLRVLRHDILHRHKLHVHRVLHIHRLLESPLHRLRVYAVLLPALRLLLLRLLILAFLRLLLLCLLFLAFLRLLLLCLLFLAFLRLPFLAPLRCLLLLLWLLRRLLLLLWSGLSRLPRVVREHLVVRGRVDERVRRRQEAHELRELLGKPVAVDVLVRDSRLEQKPSQKVDGKVLRLRRGAQRSLRELHDALLLHRGLVLVRFEEPLTERRIRERVFVALGRLRKREKEKTTGSF